MPRRWLVLNILLLATSVVFAFHIVRILGSTRLLPSVAASSAASPAAPKVEPEAPRPPVTAFDVIAAQTLFHPSRSESAPAGSEQPATPFPTLQLHGVVVAEAERMAYLEDPSTNKRTQGYRVGDSIATGRIERIEADRVVISKGDSGLKKHR
jgi:type II secretory pathway component PulC